MVVVLFAPGDVFEGYRILRVLPSEGEIQRFLAVDEVGSKVILHGRIRRKASASELAVFQERVDILLALEHAHVPRVQRAGYSKRGFFWIAVEAPLGTSLRELLRADPKLANASNALLLATQITQVMEATFERGVAHFGLTPSHIYVDEGSLELTAVVGLGIRMALDAPPAHPREAILYRAPEQIRNQGADYRADMYALGMIIYELIAGEAPNADQLRSVGVMDVMHAPGTVIDAMVITNPTRLCDRVEGLEGNVDTFVFWMINKKPEQRPATWAHVREAIGTAGMSIAMSLALSDREERERLDRHLEEEGQMSFRELATSAMASKVVALPAGGGDVPPVQSARTVEAGGVSRMMSNRVSSRARSAGFFLAGAFGLAGLGIAAAFPWRISSVPAEVSLPPVFMITPPSPAPTVIVSEPRADPPRGAPGPAIRVPPPKPVEKQAPLSPSRRSLQQNWTRLD